MSTRTVRLIAFSYVVKTLLVGAAWIAIPDLPERATSVARGAWASVVATTASR